MITKLTGNLFGNLDRMLHTSFFLVAENKWRRLCHRLKSKLDVMVVANETRGSHRGISSAWRSSFPWISQKEPYLLVQVKRRMGVEESLMRQRVKSLQVNGKQTPPKGCDRLIFIETQLGGVWMCRSSLVWMRGPAYAFFWLEPD